MPARLPMPAAAHELLFSGGLHEMRSETQEIGKPVGRRELRQELPEDVNGIQEEVPQVVSLVSELGVIPQLI